MPFLCHRGTDFPHFDYLSLSSSCLLVCSRVLGIELNPVLSTYQGKGDMQLCTKKLRIKIISLRVIFYTSPILLVIFHFSNILELFSFFWTPTPQFSPTTKGVSTRSFFLQYDNWWTIDWSCLLPPTMRMLCLFGDSCLTPNHTDFLPNAVVMGFLWIHLEDVFFSYDNFWSHHSFSPPKKRPPENLSLNTPLRRFMTHIFSTPVSKLLTIIRRQTIIKIRYPIYLSGIPLYFDGWYKGLSLFLFGCVLNWVGCFTFEVPTNAGSISLSVWLITRINESILQLAQNYTNCWQGPGANVRTPRVT